MTVLVLGGARSGKSRFAERLAARWSEEKGLPVTYLATSAPMVEDDEWAERVRRHRQQRPATWAVAEVPMAVAEWLAAVKTPQIVLVDCLSLLVNNWLFHEGMDRDLLAERRQALVDALQTTPATVIAVSNEVGSGIVPEQALSRCYRDELGWLNQQVTAVASAVYWVVAGIAIDVKATGVTI
ncbi:adenosylcobinamide kinase/adenosylcobinamide phosphate guanyltransferase [Alicyclobacillus contaminans]|uniref:bifunctional adenosylcobinamide kinase/adenosylcobinamide-phosphate guanylyltransferase n=1 Tax=Alicyclobacillus contaminans TaxID=392016 RepID=UPI00040DCB53|nr:bifunctional adenosylcobinamide kinase/adenosylcobinamide-phosphate guanylyltransferase [Alicyclobacillus contaminans]GMA48777.1 adenosylcobinamide kinase/adenosylcobinamide phosphate guanyltransferase [Alicyclobacillus contaminans]